MPTQLLPINTARHYLFPQSYINMSACRRQETFYSALSRSDPPRDWLFRLNT